MLATRKLLRQQIRADICHTERPFLVAYTNPLPLVLTVAHNLELKIID